MRTAITFRFIALVTLASVFSGQGASQERTAQQATVQQTSVQKTRVEQTSVDTPEAAAKAKAKAVVQKKITTGMRLPRVPARPVVIQGGTTAPQVVTILHGLNGLKLIRMLARTNALASIAKLDKTFQIENEIHTNVIAGLALDDGRTIAVWLPEVEAEMPPIPFAPEALWAPQIGQTPTPRVAPVPPAKDYPQNAPKPGAPNSIAGVPPIPFGRGFLEPADIKVVTREGKRLVARYVGLDGLTGLSVITLEGGNLPALVEPKSGNLELGQRLRLVGPEPASQGSASASSAIYVRIGETEATVAKITRAPSGKLHQVRIRSNRLTPANMGGIAINDAGETLGIVNAVRGNEATIVPFDLVRNAAKRVIARQASVPRPWLGVRGEPIGALSYERILREGWKVDRARELAGKREGILLTSVVPGSPAALAQLRAGDVILKVNDDEIKNAEEFTWLLDGAGPGNSVKFTIARPEKLLLEAMEIRLTESPDPFLGHRSPGKDLLKRQNTGFLGSRGILTIALQPQAAIHFGANSGLLVVHVEPSTAAFKAGLKPGDVIEAINGQLVFSRPVPMTLFGKPKDASIFNVVRNKEKIVINITAEETRP